MENFDYTEFFNSLNTPLLSFVGCNGYGKTTRLKDIKKYVEKIDGAFVFDYSVRYSGNELSGRSTHDQDALMHILTGSYSSEGENAISTFGYFIRDLGGVVSQAKEENAKSIYVFLDGIDTSLSIDNIQEIGKFFIDTFLPDIPQSIKPYVIATGVTYETTMYFNPYDPITMKPLNFPDYKSFKSYIIKTSKSKDTGNPKPKPKKRTSTMASASRRRSQKIKRLTDGD